MTIPKRKFVSLLIIFGAASIILIILSASIILNRINQNNSPQTTEEYDSYHLSEYHKIFRTDTDVPEFQKKIDILHYNLFFDLFPERKQFDASAFIYGIVKENGMKKIKMNFYNEYDISLVQLNGKKRNYLYEKNILTILIDQPLLSDTFNIKIDYSGSPKRVGFAGFVFGEINGRSLVYTLSEPDYASSWFPCNDYPSDKALLDISITNDSSQVSVSNGILVGYDDEKRRRTYHWKTVYPISTYLIAIYSSDFKHYNDNYISLDGADTMAIDYYVLPEDLVNSRKDFKQHPDIMRFFAETFGEYPFIKEKYGIAEFLWQLGAMEHQTITGVASNIITGQNFYLDIYIHELAHHWWGDAVGPKSWKDIWLNEGFATYCEALFYEFRSGKSALQSTMLSMKNDDFPGTLRKPGAFLFTNTVYNKGAWVLHMLRWELGDKLFFKILREYYNRYKYSNASTQDFKNICENISSKNLNRFFDQWINGSGIIELEYDWSTKKNKDGYESTILIEQLQSGYDEYSFQIEILVKYENHNSEYYRHTVNSLKSQINIKSEYKPLEIVLDPDNWLLMTLN